MSTEKNILNHFKEKVCSSVELMEEGVNRYRVFTPFSFEDGDEFAFVLKRNGKGWMLSDEGHTFMHLSYNMDISALDKGNRAELLSSIYENFGVEEADGSLVMRFDTENSGDALYSYLQALTKVTDLTYLNREIVKSTFYEDFERTMKEELPAERYELDYHFEEHDPQKSYPVDCYVNGQDVPLLVFAIHNDDKCRDVTINLLQYEKWGLHYRSLAIFEQQPSINRKVLARFSDVSEKQFSSLVSNKERISQYLKRVVDDGKGK